MPKRLLGAVLLVCGLGALIAGFQILSLASAGIGLVLLVGKSKSRSQAVGGGSNSAWFASGTADSSGIYYGNDNHACDGTDTGSSSSDCGDGGGGGE